MKLTARVATPQDLEACLDVRRVVFIQEQRVPEHEEVDGLDPQLDHVLALDGDRAVGTARLKLLSPSRGKAQRVAVLASHRGKGVGALVMRALEEHARTLGITEIVLDSQLAALRFYERLGYAAAGPILLDANIEHRLMRRQIDAPIVEPGHIMILGPQRPEPNLPALLDGMQAREGARLVITAGWRLDEGHHQALARVVGPDVLSLPLYAWFDELGKAAPTLRARHHERQRRVRRLKKLYRLRLRPALGVVHGLWSMLDEDPDLVADELSVAIEAVRTIDARFLERMRQLHEAPEEPLPPREQALFDAVRQRVASYIRDAAAIMIAGGHVGVLMSRLGFFDLGADLAAALRSGVPLIAWSAGAMSLTERIALFHDDPPDGFGEPDLLGEGLALFPGVVLMPHARSRLDLDDRARVAIMARRFAPAKCIGLDNGAHLVPQGHHWMDASGRGLAYQLCADGVVRPLPTPPG